MASMMKAIAQTEWGSPEVLRDVTVPRPAPQLGEVLVRVYAASINPTDVKVSEGKSIKFGGPEDPTILGTDGAGEVVEVGEGCTKFESATGSSSPGRGPRTWRTPSFVRSQRSFVGECRRI